MRQRPKIRPPRVKPRPKVPTEKAPIATALRHDERRCPAAERLLLLGRQRLAATLLAQRAARPQTEVEVVEDLGRLVGHCTQCIACFGVAHAPPPHLRPARRKRGGDGDRAESRAARSSGFEPELIVVTGDLTHRGRQARARARGGLPARPRPAAARDPGQPRHPVHLPGPLHAPVARVRAPVGDASSRSYRSDELLRRRPQLGAAVAAPVGRDPRARRSPGRPSCWPTRPRARCASSRSTTT